MKTFAQISSGLVLGVAMGLAYVYSSLPIFWERPETLQPSVYSLTWRSGLLFSLLLILMQGVMLLVFRWRGMPRTYSRPLTRS
jgi:hypothetical protein